MKSCLWLKFKVLQHCSKVLKVNGDILLFFYVVEMEEFFHFQCLLDKVCKYFIWFERDWWKRALCWSPRGWKLRGVERPPAAFRRCEGLSRFQCSASVPRATREAVWGLAYLTAQRMSCVLHAPTYSETCKHWGFSLFVTGDMFLHPGLQILVCWQPAGFLSCRAGEWRASTLISSPQPDKVLW